MCWNIKNYSSPEETEKVDNIDMVRKGNTDAEREGSGEDNSTDWRRNKKRSPWVQRAARQRHRALLSSTYQWALWVLGLWELGEPSVWLCPPFREELWSRLDCLQTLLAFLRGSCLQSGEKQYNGLALPSFLPKPHWNSLCSCSRAWLLPGEQRPTDPVRPNSTDPDIPDLPVESQTSSPSWYVQVYSGSYWTEFVLEFIPSHLPGMVKNMVECHIHIDTYWTPITCQVLF